MPDWIESSRKAREITVALDDEKVRKIYEENQHLKAEMKKLMMSTEFKMDQVMKLVEDYEKKQARESGDKQDELQELRGKLKISNIESRKKIDELQ